MTLFVGTVPSRSWGSIIKKMMPSIIWSIASLLLTVGYMLLLANTEVWVTRVKASQNLLLIDFAYELIHNWDFLAPMMIAISVTSILITAIEIVQVETLDLHSWGKYLGVTLILLAACAYFAIGVGLISLITGIAISYAAILLFQPAD